MEGLPDVQGEGGVSGWLMKKIRDWLGITAIDSLAMENSVAIKNLVEIGVDFHLSSQSTIIILSRLNGGQVRIISARFDSLKDLAVLVENLEQRYSTRNVVWDVPNQLREYLQRW